MLKNKRFIFIVGVGRSGSNHLSRALVNTNGIQYGGENRYIWDYQNYNFHDIRLGKGDDKFKKMIYNNLPNFDNNFLFYLDKTPSNSLRSSFLSNTFPDSIFIHLIRDPRDALCSRLIQIAGGHNIAKRTSRKSLSIYRKSFVHIVTERFRQFFLILKTNHLPFVSFPLFLFKNFRRFFRVAIFRKNDVDWGERLPGFSTYFKLFDYHIAAVLHWKYVLDLTRSMIGDNPNYIEIKYEDLIGNPEECLNKIALRLPELNLKDSLEYLKSSSSSNSIGKWKELLSDHEINDINRFIGDIILREGYKL